MRRNSGGRVCGVIEPSCIRETRTSYDTVADDYAKIVRPAFVFDLATGRTTLISASMSGR
ncbi:hypothetical protein BBN63_03960 [Streptomyces niveus]|uniref:Uncharacterized protein n=1 Tax=Streptomyces niveus TaxID=193462 RepID=A0A1U9QPD7_STRNV|nr:hypothetical protein BBN63_03960 [Streptomyces niveus]